MPTLADTASIHAVSPEAARLLRLHQQEALMPIVLGVVQARSAPLLTARVVAALLAQATQRRLPLAALYVHLQALQDARCSIEVRDAAKEVGRCLSAYRGLDLHAAIARAERVVVEARGICTGDVLPAPSALAPALPLPDVRRMQGEVAEVFQRLGFPQYRGSSQTPGHPILRLRGKQARWYLLPEVGPDPGALADMFLPDYASRP